MRIGSGEPAARGKGAGQALLGAAIEWARSRKLERLNLWVTEGNGPATRWYERLGFADTGQRDALQSNPTLRIMQMTLTL